MIDASAYDEIKRAVRDRVTADARCLEELRADVRPLRDGTRRIQPRSATALSLVATDGGNNQLRFDPFLIQLIRVVDSNENELCLEAISPTTPIAELDRRHIDSGGRALTALGRMMVALGVGFLGIDALDIP